MSTADKLRKILADSLQLGARAAGLKSDDRLLGEIPEFDSMAVVTVITMIEEHFDVTVDDDELSADIFETFGSLERFVSGKLAN